jgi:prepilin-type N-terminal cleavage/methylation domain-containing protein
LQSNGRNTDGFTLLEVVIAMAIMFIALSAILGVEAGSVNAATRAKQMTVVAMLARNVMVDTEMKVEGKTFEEVKKEEGGAFKEPFQDYRWSTVIKEVELPSLTMGGKSGEGGSDSGGGDGDGNEVANMMTKLITKFLSKAIREITVSITWKKGKGEQSFAVSQYWVDLNHEFELSE